MAAEPGCPLPIDDDRVGPAHGGGGRATQRLLDGLFRPAFANPLLDQAHDAAVLPETGGRLATSVDAFVVRPIAFPGGDIGSLAVHGSVNDLAMAGARPRYLTVAFVLEEGLPIAALERIVASLARAAADCGVAVVAGDTKVVEAPARGEPGLTIATTGIGVVPDGREVHPQRIRDGDVLICTGDVARHGMAVMAAREGLAFEPAITSDSAPLVEAVEALFATGVDVRCLRDATRGGLATVAIELAEEGTGVDLVVEEAAVPVREEVRGACEILGIDPLFVANEGRFLAVVPDAAVSAALAALQSCPVSAEARVVGRVERGAGRAVCETAFGTRRSLRRLSGEQLPRIC